MANNIYNINNQNSFTPFGSVLAYIGSSTIDPSGWIIANGNQRQDSNIYDNLITLGIGSRNGGYFTPPNLNAAFLRSIGSQTQFNVTFSGPSLQYQQSHSLKTHTHTASQAPHTHTTNPQSDATNVGGSGLGMISNSDLSYNTSTNAGNDTNGETQQFAVAGLVIKSVTAPIITINENAVGIDVHENETFPFSYGVVWIIKI
jgi:hypothetical protein